MRRHRTRAFVLLLSASTALISPEALAQCTGGSCATVTVNNTDMTVTGTNFVITSINDETDYTNTAFLLASGDFGLVLETGDNDEVTNTGVMSSYGFLATTIFGGDFVQVTNSGSLVVDGSFSSAIDIEDNGTVFNTGTIVSYGEGGSGVYAEDGLTVVNSGIMRTYDDNSVVIDAVDGASITNSGDIIAWGEDSVAIWLEDDGYIHNSGNIISSGPDSIGVLADDRTVIVNTGTMTTVGADTINADDDVVVYNSGFIYAVGNEADGIQAEDYATIINTGSIISQGDLAFGIFVNDSAVIYNYGDITTRIGNNQSVQMDDDGLLVNEGTIFTDGENSVAVQLDNRNVFINRGLVEARGSDSYAIFVEDSDNTIIFDVGSQIIGNVHLGPGNDTLVFANRTSTGLIMDTAGGPAQSVQTGGMPGLQATTNHGIMLRTYDPTGFALQDEMNAGITRGISSALRGSGNHTGSAPVQVAFSDGSLAQLAPEAEHGERGLTPFLRSFGGFQSLRRDEGVNAATITSYGFVGGVDMTWSPLLAGGLFVGMTNSRTEVDLESQEIIGTSLVGGGYTRVETESGWRGDFILTAGVTRNDSERNVTFNGGDFTGHADYTSYFIAPEFNLSRRMEFGLIDVEPLLGVRYTLSAQNAFREEGPVNQLDTVYDSRVGHAVDGRLQVAFPITIQEDDSMLLEIAPSIGVSGGFAYQEAVTLESVGQSVTFDPQESEGELLGHIGFEATYDWGRDVGGYLAGELITGTETEIGGSIVAGLSVRF